jgi:hypothetical protein
MFPGTSATLFVMVGIFHRLSLFLLALALAVAPLRGTLAMAPLSAAPSAHHCMQMAHGMHTPGHALDSTVMPTNRDSGHDCNRSCNGACCGGACTCVHAATTAIPVSLWKLPLLATATQHTALFTGFTQRSLPPPFRPPVTDTL